MKNKTIFLTLASLVALFVFASLASAYSYNGYAVQSYAYSKPSYYSQYNYNSNYAAHGMAYFGVNAWGRGGNPFYFGTYGYRGTGPYTTSTTSYNTLTGFRTVADSHMYVDNALDHAYFTHPELLNPRRMDNHQRYYSGLWPQRFYY